MNRALALFALLSLPLSALALGCGGDDKGIDPQVDAGQDQPDAAPDIDAAIDPTPAIVEVDYPVIAHGAALVITGTDLGGTTEVTIGGVSHTNLTDVTDTSVTVSAVDATVSVGLQVEMTTTSPLGTSAPFAITVIHLIVSEIDPDTPGADNDEFVELDTGLAEAISLDGYVLVFFNGNSPLGDAVTTIDLAADTAATGLMLIGPDGLNPQITLAGPNSIQQGEDAVAIYQFAGDVGTFPANLDTVGDSGLLDAVIWESGDDDADADFGVLASDNVVVDEGLMTAQREAVSIQRCLDDTTPLLGAAFGLLAPSPGAANLLCN